MANREDFRGISRKKVWAALAAVLAGLLAALPCFAFAAGDSGEAVTQLQTVLYAMGYMEQVPDGQYGQRTQAAAQRASRRWRGAAGGRRTWPAPGRRASSSP